MDNALIVIGKFLFWAVVIIILIIMYDVSFVAAFGRQVPTDNEETNQEQEELPNSY